MKEIKLSKEKIALVDDEDFEYLNQWKWCAWKSPKSDYYTAKRTIYNKEKRSKLSMHRVIMKVTDPKITVDHINNNPLDNQKHNLRLCSHAENNRNKVKTKKSTTSKYIGVFLYTEKSTRTLKDGTRVTYTYKPVWKAQIKTKGKITYLGTFETEELAAVAYDLKAKELFGEYASQNFKT